MPVPRTAWLLLALVLPALAARAQSVPVLFVTQVPIPADFTTANSTFGNHLPDPDACGRGGDLWIRHPDGTLRNLTRAAGFGTDGDQSGAGIAVREPCVHWDGKRALFSMVVGAPRRQYDYDSTARWQVYEISNFLDPAGTPVVARVPGQPADYNNVSPAYTTDDQVLFTSDRPRSGERHLHPQLDEYEEAPTVTGIWKLNPVRGDLVLLNHTPSGAFSPSVDSFGRVVFVRWDHLQRDQQADADAAAGPGELPYGTFDYADETATAKFRRGERSEVFPEPRIGTDKLSGHVFNQFFPWQVNDDGTAEETLGHVGRHEIGGSYRMNSFRDDPNLGELYYFGDHFNTNTVNNVLQLRESAATPGVYLGVDAPEFGTHAAGQVVSIEGAPGLNAARMRVGYLTPRATSGPTAEGEAPPAEHTGLYRNPLALADGTLLAVHTAETRADRNTGTDGAPASRYAFRLKRLRKAGEHFVPDAPLTPGIRKTVRYWSPDRQVSYDDVVLWELDPAEVRPRARPVPARSVVEAPEQAVFDAEGIPVEAFRRALGASGMALVVGRNLTARDAADFQQPFNLRVPGGTDTLGKSGKLYHVSFLQVFQGDQVRGLGLTTEGSTPRAGRRVLARPLHDAMTNNPPTPEGIPAGSVRLGLDGSMAAFVPARRALSWQLLDPAGGPVVRERYWLTFQPGEIRTCTSCHGVNERDQAGRPAPANSPQALRDLLRFWKQSTGYGGGAAPRFTSGGRDASGRFALHAVCSTTAPAVLEVSEDLRLWRAVATNAPGSGVVDYQASPESGTRFFRIRQ